MPKVVRFAMRYFWVIIATVLLAGIGLAFAVDSDNDGMSDAYELFFRLNPANSADAVENHDTDLLNNLEESALWTNPDVPDTDCDGFFDHEDSNALSRAVINWAHPDFTDGDVYTYTGPDWWLGAGKLGGEFSAGEFWLLAANSSGALYVDLDRSILTNNLMLVLVHQDNSGGVATVDLLDSNGVAVATNVAGNLIAGENLKVLRRVQLPLADYPSATRIRLNGSTAENPWQLRTSLLYIDEDADGLDADQELQSGTLDSDADSDHDGLSDYTEIFVTYTNPLIPDSDGDGLSDGEELARGIDPLNPDSDGDGVSDGDELAAGLDPLKADTDGDSLSDGSELTAGTSALNADSDGDGLSDGAELYGTIYQMISGSNSWYVAKADAERLGGHLATITGDQEQDILFQFVGEQAFYDNHLWIGAEDLDGDGQWSWITGEPFGYTRWAPERPKAAKRVAHYSRNYTRTGEGQLWFDNGPASGRPYLLEYTGSLDPLNPDTDGDGLTDGEEIRAGSNPLKIDTDGDGLSDFDEIRVHGTSPAHTDTDSDGLSDTEELAGPTDPLNPDCDGDGLPDGAEVYGTLYSLIPGTFTWAEAKADAERLGGHLATITSDQEQDILFQCVGVQAFYDNSPWFGAEDLNGYGDWTWVTGEPFDYTRWAPERPVTSVNRVAHYSRNYTRNGQGQLWYDNGQVEGRPYLLEISGLLDPFNPDCDGDGLPDGEEIRAGSNPLKTDTDSDGINDVNEVNTHGTSPCHTDTDFDGLSDPEEMALGLDPLNPDCDGDGLPDGAELCGTLYYPVYEILDWHDAKADAERLGGHLAVITSEAEYKMVNRFVGTNTPPHIHLWLGASDELQEGTWRWITGEPFDYHRFNPYNGEPDNQDNADYLQAWNGVTVWWNDSVDIFCSPYLMEFSATLDPLNPDCDGDGIPDGEEILRGMNPASLDSDGDGVNDVNEVNSGTNPGLLDSDFDGLNDGDEITAGTNPLNPDSDSDGLLDGEEVHITLTDSLGTTNTVPDMTLYASVAGVQTVERTTPHHSVNYTEEGSDLLLSSRHEFPSVTWQITVADAGMYRLALQLEPEGPTSLDPYRYLTEISINNNSIGSIVVLTNRGALAEGIIYTPWLTPGTYNVQVAFRTFMRQPMNVRIHAVELCSINGTDADGNGIPDWAQARMGANVDTDNDGLSDHDEIFIHGTSSFTADTDNDGLIDIDELALGTDALNPDTDGDGITDGVEVHELNTSSLTPEFDGTVTNVLVLPAAATNSVTGNWVTNGTSIRSACRRGELEYRFELPVQDIVRLEIEAAHFWSRSYAHITQTEDTSELDIYVDDLYIGTRELVSMGGVCTNVQIFLPVLAPGEHTLTVFWENLNSRLILNLNELRFQQLGGPDANGDGIKDWVQASLFNGTSVDSPLKSVVSPICLEGKGRYPELASLEVQSSIPNLQSPIINRGAGARWFSNIPLNETGKTAVSVSFQNGAFTRTVLPEWIAFNILAGTQTNLTVRAGDSVKLTALPHPWNGGQFTLTVTRPSPLATDEVRSPNCYPVIYTFDQPGTYIISGAYTHGNQTVAGQLIITVVDWAFPVDEFICRVNQERLWTLDLPAGATLETDSSIQMNVLSSSPTTCSLTATAVTGAHRIIARLYEGGPIISTAKLHPFWLVECADDYMSVVDYYADSQLWQAILVGKNLPPGFNMMLYAQGGGVLFDDYTVERQLTDGDFSETGEYALSLFHPNDREGSTCYSLEWE